MGKKSPNMKDFDRRNSLSRQTRRTAKQKRGKGGGGGFQDRFNPPTIDEEPARIVLFPPETPYKIKLETGKGKTTTIERDYGIVMEHFDSTANKGCRCTAALKREELEDGDWIISAGTKPCVPCHEIDSGAEHISHRKVHLFNLVRLGWFHEIEQEKEGKKGKTVKFKEHRPCRGEKKCKYCKKGVERVYGQRMYWPLGRMHIQHIVDIETTRISKRCRCGGRIKPRAFLCNDCKEAVRDIEEDPLEKGELAKLRDDDHECPHCGYEGQLEEFNKCTKCNKPKPLTLWDVELEVQKSGERMQSVIQVPDFRVSRVKVLAKIRKLMKPFEWDKIWSYKLLEPEEQAKLLRIDNPFGSSKSNKKTKGAANWDDNDNDDDDIDDDDIDDDDDDE